MLTYVNGEIQKRDAEQVLEDIGGVSAHMNDEGTLNLKLGK